MGDELKGLQLSTRTVHAHRAPAQCDAQCARTVRLKLRTVQPTTSDRALAQDDLHLCLTQSGWAARTTRVTTSVVNHQIMNRKKYIM